MSKRRQPPPGTRAPVAPVLETEPAETGDGDTRSVYREHKTWTAFLDWTARETAPTYVDDANSSRQPGGGTWDLGADWDATVQLAETGWPKGTKKAHRLVRPMLDKLGSKLRREDWFPAFEGPILDVGTFCQGIPECWHAPEPTVADAPGGLLHVVVNTWISGSQPADQIAARGAAVLAFVLLAEQAGRSVKVEMVLSVAGTAGYRIETRLTLKEYGDAVDADRLAFALVHPAAFRRLWFRWIERLPTPRHHNAPGGYGGNGPADPPVTGDVYLGPMYGGQPLFASPEAAAAWVQEQLRAQGCLAAE